MISAQADGRVDLWEVETGKKLYSYPHDVSVKCVAFSEGDKTFLSVTEQQLGFNPFIHVYPLPDDRMSLSFSFLLNLSQLNSFRKRR